MYELNRHFNLHSCRAKVCKGARKEFGKYIRSTRRWRQVGQSIAVMRDNLPSLLAGPFAGQAVVILSQFGCLNFNCFKCDIYFYFHQEKLESSFLLDKLWSLCFDFKSVQCDIHLFTKNDLKAHVVMCDSQLLWWETLVQASQRSLNFAFKTFLFVMLGFPWCSVYNHVVTTMSWPYDSENWRRKNYFKLNLCCWF